MLLKEKYLQFSSAYPLDSVKANELRKANYEKFVSKGFPTKKHEYWKYTSLKEVENTDWSYVSAEVFLSHEELKKISQIIMPDSVPLVFVNGILNKTLSDSDFSALDISEINEASFLKTSEDSVNPQSAIHKNTFYSGQVTTYADPHDSLVSLNNAFSVDRKKINIQQQLDKPIHVIYYTTNKFKTQFHESDMEKVAAFFQQEAIQITLGKNLSADVAMTFISEDYKQPLATNNIIEVKVLENAQFNLLVSQDQSDLSTHLSKLQFYLKRDAQLNVLTVAAGSKISRYQMNTYIEDEGAKASLYSLSLLNEKQHADFCTSIEHKKGLNESVQKHKTILGDESQSVFRGRIRIDQDSQKVNSQQLCKNLLLTSKAQAISVPQLEIYADDVKASHGATVGELNKEEIFYLLSRGISKNKASELLAFGFALDQLSLFKEDSALFKLAKNVIRSKLTRMLNHE